MPCQFKDIGCTDRMLRDKADEHQEKNKDKHLHCATVTIEQMKGTDTAIRQQMKQLEDTFREKIEELKQKYEKVIQQLKEEISPCPPVMVRMTNVDDKSSTFVSSVFYSHPQGYKLCIVLKYSKEELKLKVVVFHQVNPPTKWPCKGVAVIALQPENKDPQPFEIDFNITTPTNIDQLDEEGYKICSIPRMWHEMPTQNSSVTLKVEKVQLQ